MELQPIPDYIDRNLKVLFVGFNPSIRSSETGHHFANPNNRFWTILYESGLTSTKLNPQEDRSLLNIGYGLSNIVARPTKEAAEITKEEYQQGRLELLEKINKYSPKVVCFVGKGVYQQFSKEKKVPWGKQTDSISNSIEFVAPSSSGLVRMKLDEIVSIYKQLHNYI
ncbi:G/U mismatch-specific DNA glycosylase [Aquibacillus koreensis]|uniref:G/U mismatch-specific DNA glycosylase n=1 Tax=Aquibacillus koreensis TaxID=279446 RepID=A0A9X4AJ85_9BACI|nr:G/U mismatch-specific DNA glycosylase [Aquibacillus koreensis]MCT2535734.1 G/U mismatch-specific DNA glycosylase [Aquibacillus koreensis]MDC3420190.1 G/U mismatch-specific DNA glycosylase [Aquibacillus koreensis]